MPQRGNLLVDDHQLINLDNIGVILIHPDKDVCRRFTEYSQHYGNQFAYLNSITTLLENDTIGACNVLFFDVNMYRDENIENIKQLKSRYPTVKIIFLGDSLQLQQRIDYLLLGADLILSNYITKEEFGLVTRYIHTNAQINAKSDNNDAHSVMFDIVTSELHVQGTDTYIELTDYEAVIIKQFILAGARQLETIQILDLLDKQNEPQGHKDLYVFLSRLNQKLQPLSVGQLPIKEIREMGYYLTLPVKIKHYS